MHKFKVCQIFLIHFFGITIDVFNIKDEVPQEKLLTIAKFAKEVSVPVSTIRYWVKAGKLTPVMFTESGYMMFSKDQIKEAKNINQK